MNTEEMFCALLNARKLNYTTQIVIMITIINTLIDYVFMID